MDRDFKQHRIYRNGIFIVTVPNNSFYTDHPNGRGHASYIHKVCEGAAERVFRCSERDNSFTDDQSSASAITQGTKPTESQPWRPMDKRSLTVSLSSMSRNVLERNQSISDMSPRMNARPNTFPNLGTCRFCGAGLRHTFVDLGMSPPCEAILERAQLNQMEAFYPLHVFVCDQCFLVQLQEYVTPEDIFTDYAYFSSYSDSWLAHAKAYTKLIIERFKLNAQSQVVELGSNDGYLLQYFVEAGIPVLGIEPAANVAKVATDKGVPTLVKFFSAELAEELMRDGVQADLLLGNNVLAQVPDLRGFVKGMKTLLKPQGIITLEFPHLMRLIEENQFDTIYHEHFSYFSFLTVEKILEELGLTVFDVEELPTHGGSLRIYARHEQDYSRAVTLRAQELAEREEQAGFTRLETYFSFAEKVKETKRKILDFLIRVKREGKSVAGYGAPGKGNTLLNYCGIRSDFLDYTVDRNPYKHGKFLAGTHIPVFDTGKIRETKPDYVLILPWNLKKEISEQLSYVREWGGKLVVPIPEVEIY